MCFSALLACLGSLYPTPRHLSNLKFPLGSAGTLGTLGLMWSRLQPAVDSFPRVVGRQMEPGMEDLKDSPWGRGGGLGAGKAPQACSVSGNLATTPSHTSFRTLNRAPPQGRIQEAPARCLTGNSQLPGMGPWASCLASAAAGIVGK